MDGSGVDKAFIKAREGFETEGYIPKDKTSGVILGTSGVTIGNGVDLGGKQEDYFRKINVDQKLIDKLRPYFGLKKEDAEKKLRQTPLKLTADEANDLSSKVMEHEIKRVKETYNGALGAGKKKWNELSDAQRTVISSVLFQYGNPSRVPTFWKHVTNQDWTNAEAELRNFGDKYTSRRKKEADLLTNDNGTNSCK